MNILKFICGFVVALGLHGDSPVALQKTAAFKGWGPTDFVTVWTVGAGDTITLPTPTQSGITYNYNVQWGDKLVDYNVTTANKTHTYAVAGTYTNIITGTLQKWNFNNAGSKLKIVKILQFGNTGFKDLSYAFDGCSGLTGSIPSLSANTQLTTLYAAFYGCSGLTGSIPSLSANTQLTSLNYAFAFCSGLTGSIPSLSANTQLTTLYAAFYNCSGLTANTNTVLGIFGAGNMTNLTTVAQCFYGTKWVIGNSSDFTNKTFAASFTYGTDPTNSTYRMFYGQTNLTDWLTVGADWK